MSNWGLFLRATLPAPTTTARSLFNWIRCLPVIIITKDTNNQFTINIWVELHSLCSTEPELVPLRYPWKTTPIYEVSLNDIINDLPQAMYLLASPKAMVFVYFYYKGDVYIARGSSVSIFSVDLVPCFKINKTGSLEILQTIFPLSHSSY